MFVQLKCQNCGGKLEVDEVDVKIVGDMAIYRSRNTLTCQSCGTQFMRNDDLNEDKGTLGNVTIITGDNNSVFNQSGQTVKTQINIGGKNGRGGVHIGGGNVVVGGSITGGDLTIITGNGNKVNKTEW